MTATALPATGLPATGLTLPEEWAPCSDRSRERDDPLFATGSRGLQWFLVEVSSGWGTRALLDPPFDAELGRALVTRIESAGLRPLAIRRTGRHPSRLEAQTSWRWAFVDSRPGHEGIRWGEVDAPEKLLEVPLDGSAGRASDRPLFAVCAHGRHDRCCAVRGRQVATRLAEAYPEETWECSHLGGDRFAGTMVLFPHGLYYGRVDDGDAAAVAAAYTEGRVVEEFYRGRSALTHPVQAAQHFAREATGDDRLEAFAPLDEHWNGVEGPGARWVVTLGGDDGPVVVELAEHLSVPLLSTCDTTRPGQVRQWELVSLSGS
ncbi:sucrase ferredoxin [Herbiconiux sp. VKM Ac-2851]|uniref:sucrase ferredoxin n=1 Tax=Herbiconiux sp. VKM Ac-2851 TaxID=2739025 RepID=UPI001C209BFE